MRTCEFVQARPMPSLQALIRIDDQGWLVGNGREELQEVLGPIFGPIFLTHCFFSRACELSRKLAAGTMIDGSK
jgi:hypothetical protein